MIIGLFNKDVFKILTVLSLSPGSRFLRKELKEKTKMNNINLDNALKILLNSNIILKEKRIIALNFENILTKQIINLVSRQYRELKELPLNAYFSICDIISLLIKYKKIDVYLFGSYAKLIFKETSDIDLAVISDSLTKEQKKEINKLATRIKERYSKDIEVHYFGRNFYKNRKDPLVKDILKNSIKLL